MSPAISGTSSRRSGFKPDNVLVDEDERPRVVDFGLVAAVADDYHPRGEVTRSASMSALSTELTRAGALMGTPSYMSPEQLLGAPTDALSDQFSF